MTDEGAMSSTTTMVAVDGTDALAYVIIRPNPDGSGRVPIMVEAVAVGITKAQAAYVFRHVADQFDQEEAQQ